MKHTLIKRFTAVVLVCLMVMESSVSVFAGSSYSTWKTTTVLGYTYEYCSIALQRNFTSGNTLEAVALLNTENNYTNVPIGYMGAQARLMTPDLSIVYTGAVVYNWVSSAGVVAYSPSTTDDSKIFYAKSKVYLYNGNGYDEYEANMSPYTMITRGSGDMSIDNGLHDMESTFKKVNEEPEFLPAIGRNGIKGYVKSEELAPKPKTIEEAIELTKKAANDQVIPLYNEDREIIGEFVISAVTEEGIEEILRELNY